MKKYLVLGAVILCCAQLYADPAGNLWAPARNASRSEAGMGGQANPAGDLWAAVQGKYGKCRSFSCGGMMEMENEVGMENVINNDPKWRFLIRFERPDRIRVDWKNMVQSGSVFTRDGQFFVAEHSYAVGRQPKPKPEPAASMDDALQKGTSSSMGIARKIPSLLLGNARYFKGVPSMGDPVKIGEKDCDTLVFNDEAEGYKMTLAIDRKTQAILEMREYRRQGPEGAVNVPSVLKEVWQFRDITFDEFLTEDEFVYH